MLRRRFEAVVDTDRAHARALGIAGVPTFVATGHGGVGAHPYVVLNVGCGEPVQPNARRPNEMWPDGLRLKM